MSIIEDMTLATDANSIAAIAQLQGQGAFDVQMFEHDGYRISKGIEPSGPNGEFEYHVAVSRNHQPVSLRIARRYARVIFPIATKWKRRKIDEKDSATHLYAERAQPVY